MSVGRAGEALEHRFGFVLGVDAAEDVVVDEVDCGLRCGFGVGRGDGEDVEGGAGLIGVFLGAAAGCEALFDGGQEALGLLLVLGDVDRHGEDGGAICMLDDGQAELAGGDAVEIVDR